MNKVTASIVIAAMMGCVFAGHSVDTTLVNTSARAVALGNAFASMADDYATLFANPAGLYQVRNTQFGAMQTNMMDVVNSFGGAGVLPVKGAAFGAGVLFNGVNGIPLTVHDSSCVVQSGQADYSNTVVAVGVAAPVDTPFTEAGALIMGLTGKYFMENAGGGVNYSSSGLNADLGALLNLNKATCLSLVYHNFLPTMVKWDTGYQSNVEYSMNVGGRYRLMGFDQENLIYSDNQSLDLIADVAILNQNQKTLPRMGVEYKPSPYLALRGGLYSDDSQTMKLSLGMGATYQGIRFDYAFVMDPNGIDGNNQHYLSMMLDMFPAKKVEQKVEQKVVQKVEAAVVKTTSFINVESPEDHLVTYKNQHTVKGTLAAGVARLTVNDKDVPIRNERFSAVVLLKDTGKNVVRIMAYDEKGAVLGLQDIKILWMVQFDDVGDKHWAKQYIETLATARLIKGFPSGEFKPNDLIRRGEFSTLLVRTKKLAVDETKRVEDGALFVDIKNHWASPYIKVAVESGIIDGYAGKKFMPNKSTNRQETVVSMVKMQELKLPSVAKSQFKDIDSGTDLSRYVETSVENGLIVGYPDGTFKPLKDISRAEIAKVFYSSKLGQVYVNDLSDWSSYQYVK